MRRDTAIFTKNMVGFRHLFGFPEKMWYILFLKMQENCHKIKQEENTL